MSSYVNRVLRQITRANKRAYERFANIHMEPRPWRISRELTRSEEEQKEYKKKLSENLNELWRQVHAAKNRDNERARGERTDGYSRRGLSELQSRFGASNVQAALNRLGRGFKLWMEADLANRAHRETLRKHPAWLWRYKGVGPSPVQEAERKSRIAKENLERYREELNSAQARRRRAVSVKRGRLWRPPHENRPSSPGGALYARHAYSNLGKRKRNVGVQASPARRNAGTSPSPRRRNAATSPSSPRRRRSRSI